MKVLTAVTAPASPEPEDFSFATEGELVVLNPMVCDSGSCGCERAAIGLTSWRGTTTAQVREQDLSACEVDAALAAMDATWGDVFDAGECA